MATADAGGAVKEELPRRRATILTRYSRNFKMSAVVLILALAILPWALPRLLKEAATSPVKAQHSLNTQNAERMENGKAFSNEKAEETISQVPPLNKQDDPSIKLVPAPDPGLTEDTPQGSLPRIGDDNRQPWQIYARPYDTADKRPRVALIVAPLGLSRLITDIAITQLPTNVTFGFDVFGASIGAWCTRARQEGHEIILTIPMEPFDYPRSDPGPNSLLTSLSNSDNMQRFLQALTQGVGYVGIATLSGSRFITNPQKVQPILEMIKKRGLMILDSGIAPHSVLTDLARENHIPEVNSSLMIDDNMSAASIDQSLRRLENLAKFNGQAVAIVIPTPLTIDHVKLWLKDLSARGISLAPLSALAQ